MSLATPDFDYYDSAAPTYKRPARRGSPFDENVCVDDRFKAGQAWVAAGAFGSMTD
jgi:hypothetical protein